LSDADRVVFLGHDRDGLSAVDKIRFGKIMADLKKPEKINHAAR